MRSILISVILTCSLWVSEAYADAGAGDWGRREAQEKAEKEKAEREKGPGRAEKPICELPKPEPSPKPDTSPGKTEIRRDYGNPMAGEKRLREYEKQQKEIRELFEIEDPHEERTSFPDPGMKPDWKPVRDYVPRAPTTNVIRSRLVYRGTAPPVNDLPPGCLPE